MWIEIESLGHLSSVIDDHDDVVVMLTQPSWCVPCRQLKPHMERLASEDDVVVAYVDLDDVPDAIEEYDVRGVPMLYQYINHDFAGELKGRTILQLRRELS